MDHNLLKRAKEVGVDVIEEVVVSNVIQEDEKVCGVELSRANNQKCFYGHVTIDATGRASVLSRRLRTTSRNARRSRLVAFKAHLEGSLGDKNVCEIYSYHGGYGGLSTIENGLSNLCFIVEAKSVKKRQCDPESVVQDIVMRNPRAAQTLAGTRVSGPWLSVALESFGKRNLSRASGLLAIGDAASFIDPFTGSGMLMALESGELAAGSIVRARNELGSTRGLNNLAADFAAEYGKQFRARLQFSGLLRRLAFKPRVAQMTIGFCSLSESFRIWVAQSTRPSGSTSGSTSGSNRHDSAVLGK
jgi:flavin-dependent dehydrogenase